MVVQPLFRKQRIQRQLQRARAIGRPAKLVVDEAERAVIEEVDAIRLAAKRDRPRTSRGGDGQLAVDGVLEQALDDRNGTLGFHPEDRFAQPGRGRRSEKPGAFQSRFRVRERLVCQAPIDDGFEHAARFLQAAGRDRAVATLLPLAKEILEDGMDELPLAARVHHLLVFGLFLEPQHIACEELERALEIGFEAADRPCAGAGQRTRHAVELRTIG